MTAWTGSSSTPTSASPTTRAASRIWWRRLHGDSEEHLDNAHLMRMAGRFARRLRASAKANGIPVIDCKQGERKHRIANEYLATHQVGFGLFLILVARAPAPVWEVKQGAGGKVAKLLKKQAYVNHYSFHIRDPQWGHLTIKMSGHPPFPAQIILNGHEYVACQAQADRLGFTKEGNCFTRIANPAALTQIADTLSQPATVGLLMQACERWIYSACLLFGLDLDEQARSGFTYSYSVYQVEYSRNLQFRIGHRWRPSSRAWSIGPAPVLTFRSFGLSSAPRRAPIVIAPVARPHKRL